MNAREAREAHERCQQRVSHFPKTRHGNSAKSLPSLTSRYFVPLSMFNVLPTASNAIRLHVRGRDIPRAFAAPRGHGLRVR